MGQKYAAFDAKGIITGFYDDEDSPLPKGVEAIEIDIDQWQACLASPGAYTVANGAIVAPAAPTAAEVLAAAQEKQASTIDLAYAEAIQQNISFKTAAGVAQTFQADAVSQTVLMQATQGYQIAGGTPAGFYWKAADNTLVAFTLPDLEGLYSAILAQGWAAFQKRTTLKSEIAAATSVAATLAISW